MAADGTITYKVELDNKAAITDLKAVESSATESSSNVMSKIAGIGAGIGSWIASIAATVSAAIFAFTKQSVEAYANFEQLVGGVDTLFKDSSETVQTYADNAYKTAGMSANTYMETVTGFSGSLLQSLGNDTAKAAEMADLAITDMSDNANKMGTSIESIRYAYMGFAKQNYTMLDNLKLGYGGTKSEMERLIEDANKLREAQGLNADLTIDSYADIITAIHDVQTEMGITGTTALEASTTIQGSINSAKAAYENWLVALGDENADLEAKTQELFDSITTVINNVAPVIERVVSSVLENLPTWLTSIVQYVVDHAPEMLQAAIHFFLQLLSGIGKSLPSIISGLFQLIAEMIGYLLSPQFLADFADAGMQLIAGLAFGIAKGIVDLITNIPRMFGEFVDGVMDFFGIASPSKLFRDKVGAMLPEGIAVGIEDAMPSVQKAMNELQAQMVGGTGASGSTYNTTTTNLSINGMNFTNGATVGAAQNLATAVIQDLRMNGAY